ncbi:MIP/aquaporin family protein [Lacibacter sp.]|uniref:MIP/aquaporin family protein n=1 Tax=Lacibacter sp. TaxID=1915409 RepID=UPI002B4B0C59|nr:MIP/aquaporin family protein [Lacibacter sp.]HLP39148.1 MIP/aquaporin family protein [Lacibacter sp.]
MSPFLAEFIGTMFIILLGNGVVANVLLAKSKGQNGGWIVITFGWAIAVFVGVYSSATVSGAHLNPAISIALAAIGKFEWASVPYYILSQVLGAMTGSFLMWLAYRKHFDEVNDADAMMAIFCTAPAIRNTIANLTTEIIGTFVLMLGVLFIAAPQNSLGALDALSVALLVLGIGLSLGGPTGYAINPARDLGPRIMHFILPIKNKRNSDWSYSWVPIVGPLIGALIAVGVWTLLQG